MRSLPLPEIQADCMLDDCIDDISNLAQKQRYIDNIHHFEAQRTQFDIASTTKEWCNLPRADWGNNDAIILGDLTKRELNDLYSEHTVKSKGTPRANYDKIMVTADGKCPSCAGIGHVKTLDHYLPKAYFPTQSILPLNLVPACRDCNTGKGSAFPLLAQAQPIHPYLDENHFFDEKWIIATVLQEETIVLNFHVQPPAYWTEIDKLRASSHFAEYDLAKRFSVEAATELTILAYTRRTILQYTTSEAFRDFLRTIANCDDLPINGWKRAMYDGLANDDWFVSQSL